MEVTGLLGVEAVESEVIDDEIAVIPVTGVPGEGALYPGLSSGTSGLTKTAYALIDHVRSIDKPRIRRWFGKVTEEELAALDQGLELFLGIARESATC